jgi:hypothetical protein
MKKTAYWVVSILVPLVTLVLIASSASAAQPCGQVNVGHGEQARVATVGVDCETGLRVTSGAYEAIEHAQAEHAHGPGSGFHEVEGFGCEAVLAETELMCNRKREWIFASTQATDHPAQWIPPSQEKERISIFGAAEEANASFVEGSERCEDDPTFGRIVVKSGRHKQVLKTPDICESGGWESFGGVPGLDTSTNGIHCAHCAGSNVSIKLDQEEDVRTTQYHVIATTKGKRVSDWITVRVKTTYKFPTEERIYEGTDAFVNFCIDKGQEIRSHNGRLFCWRIDGPVRSVTRSYFKFHHNHW